MRPPLQERFQVYVVGPNQDPRLASIAAGQRVDKVTLKIDLDAPFVLRARALRQAFTVGNGFTQDGLQFLKTQWTGPTSDYRQSDFILESLQQPYYGQNGCPKPVSPEITYPPAGELRLDLINTGANAIIGLVFYWIGVNLYPWGTVPGPSYPNEFRAISYAQSFIAPAMASPEFRLNQPFSAKPDGDFVIRAAQCIQLQPEGVPG